MKGDDNRSPLGALNERLYSPKPVDGIVADPLSKYAPKKPEGWKPEPPAPERRIPRFSGPALFLFFAVGFFVLAGITAAVVLFLGGRSVSSDHLSIAIQAPTSVSGGESVPLSITITNDNPLTVRGALLEIDFPEGTYASEDAASPLLHVVEELGDIAPGASVRKTVRAAFFGEENRRLLVPITVEYSTDNSNATFVARKEHGLVISTAPVTLSVEAPEEVPAGQPATLTLLVRSNAVAPLENIAVRAEYPFGFTAAETIPVGNDGVFALGTLDPGEEERISITGPVSGVPGEQRVFRFSIGSLRSASSSEFSVVYGSREAPVAITRSFLSVGIKINNTDGDTYIRTGEVAGATISWQNALSTAVADGKISIALSGDALDTSSVRATGGFWRSSDRTVLFDGTTQSALRDLAPGASGAGSISLSTKTGNEMNTLRNPSITMVASVSGRRGQGGTSETVTSTVTRTLKVLTDLTITPRVVHSVGPFDNSGPWAPVADQKTTYTILMSARNTVNSVAGATVSTILPAYVRFTGQSNPVGAVTFNEGTREVSWTIGEMAAGSSKDAAFQVELLPSTSQRGTSPLLTGEFRIEGVDRFVQVEAGARASALDTEAETDPQYTQDKGIVK